MNAHELVDGALGAVCDGHVAVAGAARFFARDVYGVHAGFHGNRGIAFGDELQKRRNRRVAQLFVALCSPCIGRRSC